MKPCSHYVSHCLINDAHSNYGPVFHYKICLLGIVCALKLRAVLYLSIFLGHFIKPVIVINTLGVSEKLLKEPDHLKFGKLRFDHNTTYMLLIFHARHGAFLPQKQREIPESSLLPESCYSIPLWSILAFKKIILLTKNSVILRWNIADKVFPIIHCIRQSHSININSQLHFQILRRDFLKKIIFTFLCTTFYN